MSNYMRGPGARLPSDARGLSAAARCGWSTHPPAAAHARQTAARTAPRSAPRAPRPAPSLRSARRRLCRPRGRRSARARAGQAATGALITRVTLGRKVRRSFAAACRLRSRVCRLDPAADPTSDNNPSSSPDERTKANNPHHPTSEQKLIANHVPAIPRPNPKLVPAFRANAGTRLCECDMRDLICVRCFAGAGGAKREEAGAAQAGANPNNPNSSNKVRETQRAAARAISFPPFHPSPA
jgi:hypothetical protein